MSRRAFIIHGYLSHPDEAWLPWLKAELVKQGYVVSLPAMPHPERPIVSDWVAFITQLVGEPDHETVMIGHSIGCQAVLHYLETLGAAGKSVAKTVLVAGAFPLGMSRAEAERTADGDAPLVPWFMANLDPAKVKRAAGRCTVILSDDDPYLPIPKVTATFKATLDPRIVMEHGYGHFNEDNHLTALPAALAAVIS